MALLVGMGWTDADAGRWIDAGKTVAERCRCFNPWPAHDATP